MCLSTIAGTFMHSDSAKYWAGDTYKHDECSSRSYPLCPLFSLLHCYYAWTFEEAADFFVNLFSLFLYLTLLMAKGDQLHTSPTASKLLPHKRHPWVSFVQVVSFVTCQQSSKKFLSHSLGGTAYFLGLFNMPGVSPNTVPCHLCSIGVADAPQWSQSVLLMFI